MTHAAARTMKLVSDAVRPNVGRWFTRNGIAVVIDKKLKLVAQGPRGPFPFEVWAGHCLCCHARFTWDEDGRYAGVGIHDFDIVRPTKGEPHGHRKPTEAQARLPIARAGAGQRARTKIHAA